MNKLKKNTQLGKFNYLVFLIFLFSMIVSPNAFALENIEGQFIEIKILDKVSSKSSLLRLKINDQVIFF